MNTIEKKIFPDGVPALVTELDLGRLLGVSRPGTKALVDAHPEMQVMLEGSKVRRVKSQLYFDVISR